MYKISKEELEKITDLLDNFCFLYMPKHNDLAGFSHSRKHKVHLETEIEKAKLLSKYLKDNYNHIKSHGHENSN